MARSTRDDDDDDALDAEPDDDDFGDDDADDDDPDDDRESFATWDEWLDAYLDGEFDDDSYIEFSGGLDTGGGE